nr:reverse transcriptase domain-containing protein [Tanacetum cinerariifolium]
VREVSEDSAPVRLRCRVKCKRWGNSDSGFGEKGIDTRFCTHKILIEEDYKPAVQSQRRVNPKIHDVFKKEVIKLLDAGMIYPISDSPWVSPIHCVPKKGGMTFAANENNDLIPTREGIILGHKISKSEIEVNRAKVDVIAKLPHPTTVKGVRSFLGHAEETDKLPIIIAKDLKDVEKEALIKVLKSYKRSIAWKIFDIKGIDTRFCTHKILIEEDYKPAVQSQRRVNPKIHDVFKKEVIKLLDAGMIYPISDSPWVSPIHCVPKKGGMTFAANENNDLIPTRLVTG